MARAEMVRRDAPVGAGTVKVGRRSVRAAAALRLGVWRMRPAWRLLVAVQMGMIAAMLVVCAIPLFSQVATYTGLQAALGTGPFAHQLVADVATNTPSAKFMGEVEAHVGQYMDTYLRGADIRPQGVPTVTMNTSPLQFTQPATTTNGALAQVLGPGVPRLGNEASLGTTNSARPLSALSGGGFGGMTLYAYSHDQLTTDIQLAGGHLPQARQDGIEILITVLTASKLHLSIGSSLTIPVVPGATARPLALYVAGIFSSASASYPNFNPYTTNPDTKEVSYYAVADRDAIANSTYPWSSVALSIPQDKWPHWHIHWTYQLDVSRLTPEGASAVLQAAGSNPNSYAILLPGTADQGISINTSLYGMLSQFQRRIQIAQLAVGVLLIAVVGLMLLFVSQMGSLLIERQEGLIALLRSRGASRRQIFATFATQGIAMALVALLVGPLLAVPLIRQIALALLPAQHQSVVNALAGNPVALALGLWPVALGLTLVVAVTMLWVVKRASALNILVVRQEAARSKRNPLWRKLYLDVFAALLAVGGYGALALANVDTSSIMPDPYSNSSSTLQLLSALGLVAPLFLMVAITLLFVRVFPLLLHLGEWLATRGRGAPAQLAFAHLARSARQSARVIVLLALATGFALMTVGALATSDHYATDAATFDAGADFSGTLATPSADFTQLAGVQSAARGYVTPCTFAAPGQQPPDWGVPLEMTVSAVESERYAATVVWPDVNGTGSVAELMGLLRQTAPTPDLADTVPAIVDGAAHVREHAAVGTILALWTPGFDRRPVRFRVVAIVSHIPQMYANPLPMGGSMLVDYARYGQALAATNGATSATVPAPNYVWLRTAGDSTSLHNLRAAFASGPYQLTDTTINSYYPIFLSMHDRRIEIQEMHSDAFYVELIGTLAFGAVAVLLLALLGTVVTLWVATRDRQVSFALLRALGSGPRRILRQVLWEHSVVCAVGLALGILAGGLLTVAMVPTLPTLIFTHFGGPIEFDGGLPVRIVWPAQALGLAVGVLAVVCVGTMVLAARAAARPPLAAVLRLNED